MISKWRFLVLGVCVLLLIGAMSISWRLVDQQGAIVRPRVIAVFKSLDPQTQFWQVVKAGVETAAKEFDVDVDIRGPMEESSDISVQKHMMEQAIAEKPQAIILSAQDQEQMYELADKAVQSGIRLITLDSGLKKDISSSFVATDNVAAGKSLGLQLAGLLPKTARVAVVSYVKGTKTQDDREAGALEGLKKGGILQIAGVWYCDGDAVRAQTITKEILQKYPDISGIAGLNENSTLGVARALRELNQYQRVTLVGFDSSREEIRLMEEGVIRGVVVQRPFNMGYLAMKQAVRVIRNQTTERRIDTGSVFITPENMYQPENMKLLFPFADQ